MFSILFTCYSFITTGSSSSSEDIELSLQNKINYFLDIHCKITITITIIVVLCYYCYYYYNCH